MCSDNNACTTDTCNPVTGLCQTTPVDCNDDDACTFEACDPIGGCGYAPTLCEDFDTCTLDACNPVTGQCVFTPIGGCDGATGSVGAGGIVSTDGDDEADGASPTDPVETTVTVPGPGFVTITETAITMGAPAGFTFFGQQVVISGPSGTAANPLVIIFRLDASILPPGTGPEDIEIFRNGVFVPDCTGAPGVASPDPCVASRVLQDDDGDVEITIRTSSASDWNFAALSQQNRSIAAKKLTIVQDEATKGKAKLIFTAKDATPLLIAKGAAGAPADLTGTFELFYTDVPTNTGRFAMPPAGWKTNSAKQAKYTNELALGGPAESTTTGQGVKVAVVKPGKTAKLTAKSRGEDADKIDLLAGAPGANGITAVLTIENATDGFTYRMCTRFPNDTNQIIVKDISDGAGRKLTAKDGIPTPCPGRRGSAPTP